MLCYFLYFFQNLMYFFFFFFFFNDTATTEIYTLSLHDALPIWSIGISVCVSLAVGASPRSASRPRPSPRLFMSQNLLCQLQMRDGPTRSHIVQHDRTPVTGRLTQANVPWDDGLEDISGEIPVDFVADLQRETRAPIEH